MAHSNNHKKRRILWNFSDHICPLCGCLMTLKGNRNAANFATLDHIIPKSEGGTNNIENLRLVCRICNNKRGSEPISNLLVYQDIQGHYRPVIFKNT